MPIKLCAYCDVKPVEIDSFGTATYVSHEEVKHYVCSDACRHALEAQWSTEPPEAATGLEAHFPAAHGSAGLVRLLPKDYMAWELPNK